jgi:hypothetical protein
LQKESLGEKHPRFELISMYSENDKVMSLATGEVFTVIADFSDEMACGIVVKENIGRNLCTDEVRPAGHTRQRAEAAVGIVPPDPPPPPPPPPTAEDFL